MAGTTHPGPMQRGRAAPTAAAAREEPRRPTAGALLIADEVVSVDVPDRTFSVNQAIEARAAIRRGDRPRAFRILRAHVDDLLAADNTDVARLACVEFVNMMATIDRLPDAARALGYQELVDNHALRATRR